MTTRRRETKDLSIVPWRAIAGNLMGVTAAHAAGYASAGALASAYARSRFGRNFRQLPLGRQKRIMQSAVALAGTAAATTASLASYAGKMRTAEEQARLQEMKRLQALKMRGNSKVASVAEAYIYALQRL